MQLLNMMRQYRVCGDWLDAQVVTIQGKYCEFNILRPQLDIARYANIPVGNLPVDSPVYVADTMFARALQVGCLI